MQDLQTLRDAVEARMGEMESALARWQATPEDAGPLEQDDAERRFNAAKRAHARSVAAVEGEESRIARAKLNPALFAVPGNGAAEDRGGLLGREQRMADWYAQRARPSSFDADDLAGFSLGRAVRGAITGQWQDADVERRALAEGVNAAGGFLVPEVLSVQVIDRVRNAARVLEAGAVTVPVLSDEHSIARLKTGVTGAWRNENTAVFESDATFERVTFRLKTLAILTRLPYELVQDLSPEAAVTIEDELVQALSLELDRVAFRGTGVAPEPTGIRNQVDVDVQSLGVNGAVPTNWSPLVNAVAAIQGENIEPTAAIYSARTAKTFASLVDTTGQPLNPPDYLSGVRRLVSNQVPNALTQGTSTDASEVYVGDFSQLLIGVRPTIGVQIQKLDERYADFMQIGVLAYLRADIQLQHPEAFSVVTGVRA